MAAATALRMVLKCVALSAPKVSKHSQSPTSLKPTSWQQYMPSTFYQNPGAACALMKIQTTYIMFKTAIDGDFIEDTAAWTRISKSMSKAFDNDHAVILVLYLAP